MEDKKQRMLQLVEILNQARRAYEQEDREIMSNLLIFTKEPFSD